MTSNSSTTGAIFFKQKINSLKTQVPHILFDLDVDVSVDERVSGLMSSVVSGATRPLAVGQEQSDGSGHEPIKSLQMVSSGQHSVVRAHVLIKRFTG